MGVPVCCLRPPSLSPTVPSSPSAAASAAVASSRSFCCVGPYSETRLRGMRESACLIHFVARTAWLVIAARRSARSSTACSTRSPARSPRSTSRTRSWPRRIRNSRSKNEARWGWSGSRRDAEHRERHRASCWKSKDSSKKRRHTFAALSRDSSGLWGAFIPSRSRRFPTCAVCCKVRAMSASPSPSIAALSRDVIGL